MVKPVLIIVVLVGLVVLIAGGLYVRRRISAALRDLGVRARRIRIVRWLAAWLLFAYPILVFVTVVGSLVLRLESLPRFDDPLATYLFGLPFAWTALVLVQALPWLLASEVAALVVRRHATRIRTLSTLVVIAAFGIYTPVRVIAERGVIRLRHHDVGTGNAPPFRIGFIADVQQDHVIDATRAREVYAMVNAEHPDIVICGGDWISSGAEHIEVTAAAAATLHGRLGTFSVRGDHEHFAYRDRERSVRAIEQAMTAHGVDLLDNEVRWFDHEGKRIAIAFINYNYIVRASPAKITALVDEMAGADYKIAVTHQLDTALAAQLANRVDLVLGAHTHGGQINPLIGLTHVRLERIETPYLDGRYQRGKTTIIITAGIGYSVFPFRYASLGSLDFIDLRVI